MRRVVLIVTALGGLVLAPLGAAFPEVPVLTSVRNEILPAAGTHEGGDGLLAFARSRSGKPNVYDAYLRRTTTTGTTVVKLNTRGRGFTGGIDSPRVAFQQVVGNSSDIRIYNVDTGIRSNAPGIVNSRAWEYGPTVSGNWLLFGRVMRGGESILLANLQTRVRRTLARTSRRDTALFPGQVAGNWVVYFRCRKGCTVFRYNISTGARVALPKPAGTLNRVQYSPAVTSDGVVYLGRSGFGCGTSAKLVRFFGASDPATGSVVARLPRGRDLIYSSARENGDGSVDVFYARARCAKNVRFDIYRVSDPDPSAPPAASVSRDSASSSTRARFSASGKKWPLRHPGKRSS